MRGKYKRSRERKDDVKAHILLYNLTISHYRREHAPNRLYLPSDITEKSMYENYLKQQPNLNVSYTFFCRVVKEMNISLVKLGHEECETCVTAKQHEDQLGHGDENACHGCSVCESHQQHIHRATAARE